MRIAVLLATFCLTGPAGAQSVQLGAGGSAFNPLTIAAFDEMAPFTIDQSFAETHGVEVRTPVTFLVPGHFGLHVASDAAPSTGATVVFGFHQEATQSQPRAYLEDVQITGFGLPLFEDAEDPIHARRIYAASYLEAELFPQWASRFEQAEIFAIEAIELGNAAGALQLVAGYYDQDAGDNMMLRAVILPHPDRISGYMALASINLDLVPVTNAESLAQTLTGRLLSSWQFQ